MKKLTNIELFNGITGKVFANLYEKFPFEEEIELNSLLSDFIEPNDFDEKLDLSETAAATVKWLERADYIWLKDPLNTTGKFTATLTPKALKVLKETPDIIEPTSSIGEKIVEFAKEQFGEGLNQLVKTVIAESVMADATR